MTEQPDRLAASVFGDLEPILQDALTQHGFTEPTDTQRVGMPPILRDEDVLVVAPTGSGKTETAMLPILNALLRREETVFGIGALYITPLRALNRDMRDRLDAWADHLEIEIDVRHGDTTQYQRRKQATNPPDVLVTTPETLQAMLTGSRLRTALESVDHVVVDEVHELANSKRGAQLAVGLERLQVLADRFQRIGLSATVGDPERVGAFLTGDRGCTVRSTEVGTNLSLRVHAPPPEDGDDALAGRLITDEDVARTVRFIDSQIDADRSTLVFVNTRQTAEALGSRLNAIDANVGIHHGSLAKSTRIEVEDAFKTGDLDALLCTSSMELGIDVGRIDHVIQYQSPREVTRLLQRVGRAGHRIDRTSRGTIVPTRGDDVLEATAIATAGLEGRVEPARIHRGSLDTLANQIVGIVMDLDEVSGARLYEIVTRAQPFADLEPETLRSVLDELSRNHILWLDRESDTVSKTGETWQYFYANLSMIPDEATFTVTDIASNSQIGTLDERFVVNFATQGAIFVQRGEMWRIVEVDESEEHVRVAPIEDPAGEIPSWVGEEIPVPFDIAQRVGRYRDQIARVIEAGVDPRTDPQSFPEVTDGTNTKQLAVDPIERQIEAGHPVPTADRIVIEGAGGTIVVNCCFGHRTNETLGRMLAALLGQQTGSSVGMDADPYRIELETPSRIAASDVAAVLRDIDPDHVEALIELTAKRSESLTFRLAQVAAKFGSLKRWERGASGAPPRRLLSALADTPMYDEAVRELLHEDLNTEQANRVLRDVRSGDIVVHTVHERTPIGLAGRSSMSDLLTPENADASVIETVKERLLTDDVTLSCLHCREWTRTKPVRRVAAQPECPSCGSTRITALSPWDDETLSALSVTDPDADERSAIERAYKAANLVQSHGRDAVIALTARGVGPHNAARIIGKLRENEADFYRDLLEQERQYARTRSFWD